MYLNEFKVKTLNKGKNKKMSLNGFMLSMHIVRHKPSFPSPCSIHALNEANNLALPTVTTVPVGSKFVTVLQSKRAKLSILETFSCSA